MRDRTPGVHDAPPPAPNLSPEEVWRQLGKASFLVLSQVNPAGEPRSSGVIYKTMGRRLYVATAPDSWKARHIAARPDVAVTVLVRRGGILSLLAPIPPATVTFHATAVVHPAGSMEIPPELRPLLPPNRQAASAIIEIIPEGNFLTYGLGVSLMTMRTPAASRARVPVS